MSRQIQQLRYYGPNSENNSPASASSAKWINGQVFNSYYPIIQLGIQAIPGTKFYLNQSSDPICIGATGLFELDLSGGAEITDITFSSASIANIANNSHAGLIVDIIYEKD